MVASKDKEFYDFNVKKIFEEAKMPDIKLFSLLDGVKEMSPTIVVLEKELQTVYTNQTKYLGDYIDVPIENRRKLYRFD